MRKIVAIIVAGGQGKRMGMAIKKQYILLKEKEILAYTLESFQKCEFIDEIIVVVAEEEKDYVKQNMIDKYQFSKVKKIATAGKERQDSVYNGLLLVSNDTDYVIVHDGARPFVSTELIMRCLEKAQNTGASIAAVPVKDTIKICDPTSYEVKQTPNRALLWSIQTPQVFNFDLLLKAYQYARDQNLQVTDDSMIIEAFGKKVYITEGEYNNIKITTPEDLMIAEAILSMKWKDTTGKI